MPSNFDPISICACVSCGRTADQVELKRLKSNSRAWACFDCMMRFGIDALDPASPLAIEADRQFGECVGQQRRVGYCRGLGGKPCGSVVFVRPDGTMPWFCSTHEREWRQAFAEGWKENNGN
jgi:hypothetical protein